MKTYLDFMRSIKASPVVQVNKRTGIECRMVLGEQLKFHDVGNQFPATTTKQLAFKGMRGELLGFFRGYTNAADFRALNCQVWNQNANETPAWLANIYRKGEDDLGVVYGKQWTAWKDRRIAETSAERDRLVAAGYTVRMMSEYIQDEDGKHYHWLMERDINQLENVLRMLLTDPTDRRMIVSGWNVAELDMMALPPCHMDYRFSAVPDHTNPDGPMVLHVTMTIRSWDVYLGGPFNISETALFLCLMARLAGMTPGSVTVQATNAHLYSNHMDKVDEQLMLEPRALPKLVISDRIQKATLETIAGIFERIEPDDMWLEGYDPIKWDSKAPMAV